MLRSASALAIASFIGCSALTGSAAQAESAGRDNDKRQLAIVVPMAPKPPVTSRVVPVAPVSPVGPWASVTSGAPAASAVPAASKPSAASVPSAAPVPAVSASSAGMNSSISAPWKPEAVKLSPEAEKVLQTGSKVAQNLGRIAIRRFADVSSWVSHAWNESDPPLITPAYPSVHPKPALSSMKPLSVPQDGVDASFYTSEGRIKRVVAR